MSSGTLCMNEDNTCHLMAEEAHPVDEFDADVSNNLKFYKKKTLHEYEEKKLAYFDKPFKLSFLGIINNKQFN